ncbi:unnamed protein product [Ambrosiozyma monospora]|uniref:Unnamed protein product n=1 Tax=Ambrosiozyma monospora TaxID=43982 RepID=A0A9W7DBF7_AMBMO|nr:unnamed protein product [Ambrosiozyma monospora]
MTEVVDLTVHSSPIRSTITDLTDISINDTKRDQKRTTLTTITPSSAKQIIPLLSPPRPIQKLNLTDSLLDVVREPFTSSHSVKLPLTWKFTSLTILSKHLKEYNFRTIHELNQLQRQLFRKYHTLSHRSHGIGGYIRQHKHQYVCCVPESHQRNKKAVELWFKLFRIPCALQNIPDQLFGTVYPQNKRMRMVRKTIEAYIDCITSSHSESAVIKFIETNDHMSKKSLTLMFHAIDTHISSNGPDFFIGLLGINTIYVMLWVGDKNVVSFNLDQCCRLESRCKFAASLSLFVKLCCFSD